LNTLTVYDCGGAGECGEVWPCDDDGTVQLLHKEIPRLDLPFTFFSFSVLTLTAMAKRRVPAALHHELTEYASLLRALRVRDAMDITKHITKPSPFAIGVVDDNEELNSDDDLDDDEELSPRKQASHASGSISGSSLEGTGATSPQNMSARAKGKRKAEDSPNAGKRKQRRRNHWTRWPVPLEDVLLPEWTLEDEVAVIASQVMKLHPPPVFPVPPAGSDDMDDEEGDDQFIRVMDMEVEDDDPDNPFYVPYITSIVAEYLSTILGLLASLTPARPASMQNRIEPLGWRTIIDVVATCGIPEFTNAKYVALVHSNSLVVSDPCCRVVRNVIKRMEAIYGLSIIPLDGKMATSYRGMHNLLL